MGFDPLIAWNLLPKLLGGAGVAISILIPTLILGFVISLPMALARLSQKPILRWPSWLYVLFFRGVPLLVLLYMVYHGIPMIHLVRDGPLWDIFKEPYYCAIVAFTLNHTGFVTEILRGGLEGIPRGVIEAAEALALPKRAVLFRVKLPLAIRLSLSAYQNEVIFLTKGTAAVSAITLVDVLGAANDAVSATYDPFTPLVMAAIVYWTMTQCIRLAFGRIQRRLHRYPID